jgi:AcrR family transcriptional regulator
MASHGTLRSRVLDAAKELFIDHGYDNTSLAQIARKAGTSPSGLLRVCESKTMLLQMVFGLCWLDKNVAMDTLIETATRVNPDPKFVAVAVSKGLLERYEYTKKQTHFMLSMFPAFETPAEYKNYSGDAYMDGLLGQYSQYIERMHKLAAAILDSDARLIKAEATVGALREYLATFHFGVQMRWFVNEQSLAGLAPKLTLDEAIDLMILFLYTPVDSKAINQIKNSLKLVSYTPH